jgi:hypothetical protein
MEEQSLISMLDDIGLSKEERRLVDLIMDSRSIEEIENMTGMNKVEIARARVSISDKITHWGKI